MQQNDKIYFRRGPLEFVGVLQEVRTTEVVVSGVEVGCLQDRRLRITLSVSSAQQNLQVISAEEFAERTKDEPAFMDKLRYLELQQELEALKLPIKQGQVDQRRDARIMEIEAMMGAAPWVLSPGDGCIPKDGHLSVTLEDLLATESDFTLDKLLTKAASECGYHRRLDCAWRIWHYGRHAEFADELGMLELSKLFSAAWQIQVCVHGESDEAAEVARQQIRGYYQQQENAPAQVGTSPAVALTSGNTTV